MNQKNRITSNRAFILAIAGAAIGLGNIWRFPYIAGENGGSVFLLWYLFFLIVMGLPVMIAEIAIGRAGRASPASSLRQLAVSAGHNKHWSKLAWLGTLTAVLVLSFYSVISGWALYYFYHALNGALDNLNAAQSELMLENLLLSPGKIVLFHTLFISMTMLISGHPVSKGIERLNNLLMPLMYLVLVLLVIYASGFSGFDQAKEYLFAFKYQDVNGSVLLEALGHAFFTLAVGACCLMAYGAYMPEDQSIVRAVLIVALLDVLVAVMVGLSTFSVVFTEGLPAAGGPGLMFVTLPVALSSMPFHVIVLPLFFLLLVIASWTSAVNLAEPLVVMATRITGSRARGAVLSGLMIWCMGLIPALSFNLFRDLEPFPDKSIFDIYTAFPTQILLPLTGLLILFFAGYVMDRKSLVSQLGLRGFTLECWKWLIRYVSPLLLLTVMLGGLLTNTFNHQCLQILIQ